MHQTIMNKQPTLLAHVLFWLTWWRQVAGSSQINALKSTVKDSWHFVAR